MKRVLPILALAAAASGLAAPAYAQSTGPTYRAVAAGPFESPPNDSLGYSVTTVELPDGAVLVDAPFRDLVGTTTAAHIHCCTTDPFTGVAPAALPFAGFPTEVRAGDYSASLDLYDEMSYDPAFVAANGGTVQGAASALVDGINANQAYVNIHTTAYPSGEIRGFLVAAPIPEPAEWAMLGVGVVGLLWMSRRRQPSGLAS